MREQDVSLVFRKSQDASWECYNLIFLNRYLSETQCFNLQDYSPYAVVIKSTRLKLVIMAALCKVAS